MAINPKIKQLIDTYGARYDQLDLISLSTADGFPIYNYERHLNRFAADKMAAAASTLYAVSNAVAKQILSKNFQITFVETENGNIAFVALALDHKDHVLSMSGKHALNIAKLRLLLNRLAQEMSSMHVHARHERA